MSTPINLAHLANSDTLIETIQIQIYLDDVPEWGRRDFHRYLTRYGDSNYIYRSRQLGDNWERDNRLRDKWVLK